MRPATARDLDRAALLLDALSAQQAELDPRFARRGDAAGFWRDWLARRLRDRDARVLVAESAAGAGAAQLLGICVVGIGQRPEVFAERRRGEIEYCYVRPEARRKGVGRALVDAAIAFLAEAGLHRVALSVAVANPAARAFWGRLGFAPAMDVLDRSL